MIITRNWLNEFINIEKISTDEICAALNSIGLEVDSTSTINIPTGVKVGHVESCEKHPDADKLNICQVNLGDETTQIVCGAKNVAAGQYVPVATVGTVLGEDFKIKKAKLRGVESNGMICSSSEVGLPESNDGILVLDDSIGTLELGKELNSYDVLNDEIIEIELTANRGDCLSIHGVARDLSSYFNIKFQHFNFDINYSNMTIGQILNASSEGTLNSQLILSSADFSEFKLPTLLRIRTAIASCYNKNEALTAAAYATHSVGVLYDMSAKKLDKDDYNLYKLIIKEDENGFESFYSKDKISTIAINTNDVILEESDNISKVLLAALYVNPDYISQKVFDTKIKTDDVYYKSSRGSEYDLELGTEYLHHTLSMCNVLIHKSTKHFVKEEAKTILTLKLSKIHSLIGQEIDPSKIIQILESLKFKVKLSNHEILSIEVPFFRHDIKNIADITEEIVRIVGIDNIEAKPLAMDEKNHENTTSIEIIQRNNLRKKAISNGFFETITYVFSSRENLEKYNFPTVLNNKDISNPITKELNTFRTTLLLNLVDAVSNNYKHGLNRVSLFESGTVFNTTREESRKLSFIYSGIVENENISNAGKPKMMDLFTFASQVSNVIGDFELEPMKEQSNNFIHPYQNGDIIIDGQTIGYISKLHPSVANDFDIDDTFIAEIDFDKIPNKFITANDISKFQASKRDLSIIAPKSLEYRKIKLAINELNIPEIKQFNLVDIYSDEKLGDNESLTIKFVLQHDEKTMDENGINTIMEQILEQLNNKLNIGIR